MMQLEDLGRIQKVAAHWKDTCFLCRWILGDIAENGKLTGYPFDHSGGAQFPVPGKLKHIELELQALDNRGITDI